MGKTRTRAVLSVAAFAAAVIATLAPEWRVSAVALPQSTFVVPQLPILQECKGSVDWTPVWGSHFIDASRNCDNDLDRAGVNGPDGVYAMDFDGDCDQDIITGWEENGRVFVYLNPRLRQRPVAAGVACPKTYPAAAGDDHLVFQQWPYSEVTRDDTNDARPFRGVEDAIFVDNNADGVADYVVISTEIGSNSDGRREVFVSVPSSVSATNVSPATVQWTTFRLTGEENYMRAAVGDLNGDGCLDIVAGSKSAQGASGDIRWWQCPTENDNDWTPEVWKSGPKAAVPDYRILRQRWGQHHLIETKIVWIMEMVVTDLESTEIGGTNYPELVFTDRAILGYFRVADPDLIHEPDGWELVTIDQPGKEQFRWLGVGQLVKNGPNGSDGAPEIVVAYNDPIYSSTADNGVFARWYERISGSWHRYDVVLHGGKLPWTYHKDNANKAAAFADMDGDGQNEIVGSIRGLDYSSVFYLTPRAGKTAADLRCNDSACGVDKQWLIHRITPHFSGGEVKADNLALVDLDLDCDIDVASVDENFGDNARGMGVAWYSNTVPQQGFPCNRPPSFSSPDVSALLANEGATSTRVFTVRDGDDPTSTLTVTLAPGSPGQIVATDRAAGTWTWRDTAIDGVANPVATKVTLIVNDGWTNGIATVGFDYTIRNVAPTITSMQANPATVVVGQVVIITAISTDPAGAADTYTCHLDFNDGATETMAAAGGECSTVHSFASPGTYRIEATIADEDGGTSAPLASVVEVANPAPIVAAPTVTAVTAGPLREGGALRVRATFTDEAPSGPYTCGVDFGDGNTATFAANAGACEAAPYAYADDGNYTVVVKVTDKYSVTGQSSVQVVVANVVPVVSSSAASINENGLATIGGSIADPGRRDAFTITVSWGDGRTSTASYPAGATAWSAAVQYLDDNPTGTPVDVYAVTVSVLDDGVIPAVVATTVTVANVAPVVGIDSATDESGNQIADRGVILEHTEIAFTASLADVGSRDTHGASVDWGDGSTMPLPIDGSTVSGSHTFVSPGTRRVEVTVTDDDTGRATATLEIEVVDALGAVVHLLPRLRDRLGRPETTPEMDRAIRRALAELEGQRDGRAGNGALDLLSRGAWTAALVKLRKAVVELEGVGLDAEASLLVMAARSLLIDLIEQAGRHPSAAAEAEQLVRSIEPDAAGVDQIDVCLRALVVLRPALG